MKKYIIGTIDAKKLQDRQYGLYLSNSPPSTSDTHAMDIQRLPQMSASLARVYRGKLTSDFEQQYGSRE